MIMSKFVVEGNSQNIFTFFVGVPLRKFCFWIAQESISLEPPTYSLLKRVETFESSATSQLIFGSLDFVESVFIMSTEHFLVVK